MRFVRFFARILTVSLVFLAHSVSAQQIKPLDVERDPNGIDLLSGKTMTQLPELSIPAAPRLRMRALGDLIHVLVGRTPSSPTGSFNYSINYGNEESDSFSCIFESGDCKSEKGNGSRLQGELYNNWYSLDVPKEGRIITFQNRASDD